MMQATENLRNTDSIAVTIETARRPSNRRSANCCSALTEYALRAFSTSEGLQDLRPFRPRGYDETVSARRFVQVGSAGDEPSPAESTYP